MTGSHSLLCYSPHLGTTEPLHEHAIWRPHDAPSKDKIIAPTKLSKYQKLTHIQSRALRNYSSCYKFTFATVWCTRQTEDQGQSTVMLISHGSILPVRCSFFRTLRSSFGGYHTRGSAAPQNVRNPEQPRMTHIYQSTHSRTFVLDGLFGTGTQITPHEAESMVTTALLVQNICGYKMPPTDFSSILVLNQLRIRPHPPQRCPFKSTGRPCRLALKECYSCWAS
jgi:hypothetical protein